MLFRKKLKKENKRTENLIQILIQNPGDKNYGYSK